MIAVRCFLSLFLLWVITLFCDKCWLEVGLGSQSLQGCQLVLADLVLTFEGKPSDTLGLMDHRPPPLCPINEASLQSERNHYCTSVMLMFLSYSLDLAWYWMLSKITKLRIGRFPGFWRILTQEFLPCRHRHSCSPKVGACRLLQRPACLWGSGGQSVFPWALSSNFSYWSMH